MNTSALVIIGLLRKGSLLCMVALLCLRFPVSAQPPKNSRIDSLLALVPAAKEDTNKVKLLIALASNYPNYDPNKGFDVAKLALDLAQKLHWEKGRALAYIDLGINENSRTHYIAARTCFEQAAAIADDIEDKSLKGRALKNLGITCFNSDNFPEAMKYFFEAVSLEEELHDDMELHINFEFIGRVYESQKNFDKALEYYKKSYSYALKAGENKAKVKNLLNIGEVYLVSGRVKESLDYFEKTLAGFKEINDQGGIAVSLAYTSEAYALLHRYGEALEKKGQALNIYMAYSDRFNIASMMGDYAKVYLAINADSSGVQLPDSLSDKKENLKKAFACLEIAMKLCRDISYLDGLSNTYRLLSTANDQAGDHKKALENFKEYISIRDSIYSSDNNVKISNLEINRAVEIKDQELKIKKLELQKKRNESIYFISGMVLLLVITLILYRDYSTQKKLNATITRLVNEQEKTIELRTEALTETNARLVDLIQFNVHTMREPMTRIMGLLMLREEVGKDEFFNEYLPLMEEAVNDLDATLKDVVATSEQTKK